MNMGWLKAALAAIASFFRFLGDRQLLEAGKDQQIVEEVKEVQVREEKAKTAVTVDDPIRTARLRKKYDRAASGK